MRKWITSIITAGLVSVGVAGLAAPAQAGGQLGKGVQLLWEDTRPTIERVSEARKAAQEKVAELVDRIISDKELVDANGEPVSLEVAMGHINPGKDIEKNEKELLRYSEVVNEAENAYATAVNSANDLITNSKTIAHDSLANSKRTPEESIYRLYVGYRAYLNAAADAYIKAVSI